MRTHTNSDLISASVMERDGMLEIKIDYIDKSLVDTLGCDGSGPDNVGGIWGDAYMICIDKVSKPKIEFTPSLLKIGLNPNLDNNFSFPVTVKLHKPLWVSMIEGAESSPLYLSAEETVDLKSDVEQCLLDFNQGYPVAFRY